MCIGEWDEDAKSIGDVDRERLDDNRARCREVARGQAECFEVVRSHMGSNGGIIDIELVEDVTLFAIGFAPQVIVQYASFGA